jgi:hypothetical protein
MTERQARCLIIGDSVSVRVSFCRFEKGCLCDIIVDELQDWPHSILCEVALYSDNRRVVEFASDLVIDGVLEYFMTSRNEHSLVRAGSRRG